MIQHIRILSIFSFVRISKIHTYAPNFEMNRPPKWCSQPRGGHLAQSWSWFCDFGRKLENLGVPVYIQWCSATDGRTRLHEPWKARWMPFTSLCEKLIQAYLVFLIFGQRNKTSSVLCNLTDLKLKTTFWHPNLYRMMQGEDSAFNTSFYEAG